MNDYRSMSPAETADMLGCSRRFVDMLLAAGELDSYRTGRLRRVFTSSVEKYIERRYAAEQAGQLPASGVLNRA